MKKGILFSIVFSIIFYACHQEASKELSNDEVIDDTNQISKKSTTKEASEIELNPKTNETKNILDTIVGTSNNGEIIKIYVYKYLSNNNTKYIRDFDLVNSDDSVIISAMPQEYHWKGEITDSDVGEINLIPTYSISSIEPLTIIFGFYINPYEWNHTKDYSVINGVKEYLSYAISDYLFQDSVMAFYSMQVKNNKADSQLFMVKETRGMISIDSILTLKNSEIKDYAWVKNEIIKNSFANFVADSITYDQCVNLVGLEYGQINSSIHIVRYLLSSYIYHH